MDCIAHFMFRHSTPMADATYHTQELPWVSWQRKMLCVGLLRR